RMFIFRELTPASTLMVAAGAIAIATIALELAFGYAAYHKGLARFQVMAHTVVLIMGLYVAAVLLFYTVPILCQLLYSFIRFEWFGALIDNIRWSWAMYDPQNLADLIEFVMSGVAHSLLIIFMFVLFGFSASLFVAMPYALVNMFVRSWGRILQAFGRQYSWQQGWLLTGGIAATFAVLCFVTSAQPQTKAFTLLESAPDSEIARQALVRQSPQIRQGLLNAYLFPYRYLSPWNEANAVKWWYPRVFPITEEQATGFQNIHNALLSPFLYQGDRADLEKAADLYAEFFDTPIQKAEAETIQHALQSTVNQDSVEASLLNISDRVVALTRQEVTVDPHGDWAEVTLYERYENNTLDDQEIVYQFSLPESTVITGLWLAEPGVSERYRFVVSPRGAAQQVYKQEIERAQRTWAEDPALLEQVGPQQYRLRVFPIPRRESRGNPGVTHLWMTYQVMQEEGTWPLPQLTEKRNLYWTNRTERYRSGQAWQHPEDVWYEAALPAETQIAPQEHTATLAEGYQVTATPIAQVSPPPLQNQHIAILVDTSRSMDVNQGTLANALAESQAIAAHNNIDWYLTSAEGIPAKRLTEQELPTAKEISFYGSLTLTEQLQQFETLRQGDQYDAVFVLTDAGNYELETDTATAPTVSGSLWFVHLGGDVPPAYSDDLQQQLYISRGGVTTNVAEAISRFATEQQQDATVMDGYQWEIASAPATENPKENQSFAPFAARQAIRWLSRSQDLSQVESLDGLHAIAKRTEVVTPYSSMLVLVNDRQRQALAEAEASADRFSRAIESGEDTLTDPGNPLNTAVIPEGQAPLGIAIGGAALLWLARRRRSQSIATPPR
ncbi:MAG: TIGR02921 family PEP-CTERM protein, partial [Leptolyngbya sp. SIO1D8]|nr:TIGR02921 family PEP-CTERM protein [Leptolyngbya sp. SIO1D8]